MKANLLLNAIALILLLSAAVLFALAWYFYYATAAFMASARSTQGAVVELLPEKNSEGRTLYRPVFEYFDAEGTRHTLTSRSASSPPWYSVGDKVDMLYDVNNPGKAKQNTFATLWLAPLLLSLCGGSYVIISCLLVFVPRFLGNRRANFPLCSQCSCPPV